MTDKPNHTPPHSAKSTGLIAIGLSVLPLLVASAFRLDAIDNVFVEFLAIVAWLIPLITGFVLIEQLYTDPFHVPDALKVAAIILGFLTVLDFGIRGLMGDDSGIKIVLDTLLARSSEIQVILSFALPVLLVGWGLKLQMGVRDA